MDALDDPSYSLGPHPFMSRPKVLRFALTLVVGYATLVLIFVAGQRYLLFRGWSLPSDLALLKAYSPGMSSVEIRTKDGETLAGFWRAPKPGTPVIISFHGNRSMPQPGRPLVISDHDRLDGWEIVTGFQTFSDF